LDRASPHAAAAALQLAEVARRFERRWALRGVSLRVERGEVLAVVGRNGSGKTTLLRVVATLLRPTRGSGAVYGRDLLREPHAVRPLVGMLGHTNGLYGDLTAAENLRFALRMLGHPADAATIARALDEVGLGREAHERVRTLSAGMQRRLALARLRLKAPLLLLLDEPYSAFDPEGIERVHALLAETRERGGAALLVTHDLARAQPVVDRVMRLEAGRAVPVGVGLDDAVANLDERGGARGGLVGCPPGGAHSGGGPQSGQMGGWAPPFAERRP
jgi:heme exporter protein A